MKEQYHITTIAAFFALFLIGTIASTAFAADKVTDADNTYWGKGCLAQRCAC